MVEDPKLAFRCSACGNQYSVSLKKLPPGGAKGPCKKCGATITIYTDGRMEGAVPDAVAFGAVQAPAGPRAQPSESEPVLSLGRRPPPTTSFIYPCPACARPNEIRLSAVPPQGLALECSGCHAPLLVMPEGRVTQQRPKAIPQPQPVPGAEAVKAWEIQFEGQTMGPFGLQEMTELIKAGRLTGDAPVRALGGLWATAGAFPALAAVLAPPAPEVDDSFIGNEDSCYAHQQTPPAYTCGQCNRFMCEECAKVGKHQHTVKTFKVCGVCGGLLSPFKREERWTPFYKDMGQVLTAPIVGHALMYFIILAVIQLLKIPCVYAGCMGIVAAIFLSAFQWAFYLHVVNAVAHGSYKFPEWPETSDAGDMFWGFVKVIFVVLVSLIPVILIGLFASAFLGAASLLTAAAGTTDVTTILGPFIALAIFLLLLYNFYLPIPIAIVAVFNTVLPALNPILIFRIIFRIGAPYFAAYGLWLAFGTISVSIQGALKSMEVPILGTVLAVPVEIYATLLSCYVLGRVVRENEEKIGWH